MSDSLIAVVQELPTVQKFNLRNFQMLLFLSFPSFARLCIYLSNFSCSVCHSLHLCLFNSFSVTPSISVRHTSISVCHTSISVCHPSLSMYVSHSLSLSLALHSVCPSTSPSVHFCLPFFLCLSPSPPPPSVCLSAFLNMCACAGKC